MPTMKLFLITTLLFLHHFNWATATFLATNKSDPFVQKSNIWNQIYNATGGREQFLSELSNIKKHASSLRSGNPACRVMEFTPGGNGVVGRLCFEDDVCWATKISIQSESYYSHGMKQAVRSLKAIESHCPHLPVPRVFGDHIDQENATLCYYFMDWIEGTTLTHNFSQIWTDLYDDKGVSGDIEVNITIPENVTVQLASFAYNLSTCPIPKDECIPLITFSTTNGVLGSELIHDPLHGIFGTLKASKDGHLAREWARRSLAFHRYFLNPNILDKFLPLKTFTWLDEMALLISCSSRIGEWDDLPFVLHYWDLRPFNIILNDRQEIRWVSPLLFL